MDEPSSSPARCSLALVIAAGLACQAGLFAGASGCRAAPAPGRVAQRGALRARVPLPGGEVVLGTEYQPMALNFHASNTDSVYRLTHGSIFESLVERDEGGQYRGRLARSFEVLGDGREMVFHLRANVRWHDGEFLSAKDVVSTLEKVRAPHRRNQFGQVVSELEVIEATGALTVRLRWRRPLAFALDRLEALPILPAHIYGPATSIDSHWANNQPTGTGPYRFVRWQPRRELVLERFDSYWGPPGNVRFVRYRFIGSLPSKIETSRNVLASPAVDLARAADLVDVLGQLEAPSLAAQGGPLGAAAAVLAKKGEVLHFAGPRVRFYLINGNRPLWRDTRVRQALGHLFDGQRLVNVVYGGHAAVQAQPLWSRLPGFHPNLRPRRFDPALANRLLEEAGWQRQPDGTRRMWPAGPPLSLKLILEPRDSAELELDVLRQGFAQGGVRVESVSSSRSLLDTGAFDVAAIEWWMRSDALLVPLLHSREPDNVVKLNRPDIDRLLDQLVGTTDRRQRVDLERSIAQALHDDPPWVGVLGISETLWVSHGLQGFRATQHGVSLGELWRSDLVPDALRAIVPR